MTTEDIRRLAELSKLKFSDEELEKFVKDFDEIGTFFEQLDKIDENLIVSNASAREFEQLREDVVLPSFNRDLILKNAPQKDSISFIVPKVVE